MPVIFIAGTDTGVGKTVITKLLADYLASKGYKTATQKWVETGVSGRARLNVPYQSGPAVYSFKLAASPHLAAKVEGRTIKIGKIKAALKKISKDHDFVIVEGTGGLLVPLNEEKLLIDVVKELKIPVILVSANRLGAINHTLLSIEALRTRNMKILGIVFNNISRNGNHRISKNNPEIIKKIARNIPIWIIPYVGQV